MLEGQIVESPGKGQQFEVKALEVELVGDCSGSEYPLQKKRHTLEFLRSIAHLRPRSGSTSAMISVSRTLQDGRVTLDAAVQDQHSRVRLARPLGIGPGHP